MKFFEGCTALITGASSGLGAEFACQLAPYAANLILVARRVDRLEQLRYELSARYPEATVFIFQADLSKEEDILKLVEWITTHKFPINFLINNAGVGDHGDFISGDWNRIRAMIEVNIIALTRLTHLLLPLLESSEHAAILNVGSVAGMIPLPGSAVYAATKAYVSSFSEALRIELRRTGITVSTLCPGPVETEFFDHAAREGDASLLVTDETRGAFLISAEEVVRCGLEAVASQKPRVIPGAMVCLAITLASLLPLFLLRLLLQRRYDQETMAKADELAL